MDAYLLPECCCNDCSLSLTHLQNPLGQGKEKNQNLTTLCENVS